MCGKCYPHATETFYESNVCVNPLGEVPSTPGEKIRYYRQMKGISQKKLAADAGVFYTTILRYENLQAPVTLEACSHIAPVLGIETALLYDDYLYFISGRYWDKIREIRQNLCLSQREFAKELGITSKTVFKWEKGKNIPSRTSYKAITDLTRSQRICNNS